MARMQVMRLLSVHFFSRSDGCKWFKYLLHYLCKTRSHKYKEVKYLTQNTSLYIFNFYLCTVHLNNVKIPFTNKYTFY